MDQPTQTTEQVWPERPLEDYLAELRETGFTVLDNLVDEEALARIVAATDARIPELDPPPPNLMAGSACQTGSPGAKISAMRSPIRQHSG